MNEAIGAGYQTVVGYEANGGFLTGTDITNTDTGALLPALPTRDAALPVIAVLLASLRRGGLLRGFPNESGKALVEKFRKEETEFATATFSADFGEVDSIDFTDGARITFQSGDIVHLRPSGNAPEFRCYTESSSEDQAIRNNDVALKIIAELKGEIV